MATTADLGNTGQSEALLEKIIQRWDKERGFTTTRIYKSTDYTAITTKYAQMIGYKYECELETGPAYVLTTTINADTLAEEDPAEAPEDIEEEPVEKWGFNAVAYTSDLLSSKIYNMKRVRAENIGIAQYFLKNTQLLNSGSTFLAPTFTGSIAEKNFAMEMWFNLFSGVRQVTQYQPVITLTYTCSPEYINKQIFDLSEAIITGETLATEYLAPDWIVRILDQYPTGPWDVVNGIAYTPTQPDSTYGWKVGVPKIDDVTEDKKQVTIDFHYGDYSLFVESKTDI